MCSRDHQDVSCSRRAPHRALLGIPVVIGGNGGPTAAACGELSVILDTIRTIKSRGDYTAPRNRGGAFGMPCAVASSYAHSPSLSPVWRRLRRPMASGSLEILSEELALAIKGRTHRPLGMFTTLNPRTATSPSGRLRLGCRPFGCEARLMAAHRRRG